MAIWDIVQDVVIKTIPKKRKFKREKWLSEDTLERTEKRREVKGKEEKDRYIHLDAEFQRTARSNKKAFLSDQCKEVEKTIEWERLEISSRKSDIPRKHFTKETFHANMGTTKDRNGIDLTEAEDIEKRL